MRDLREALDKLNPKIENSYSNRNSMPVELIYVDDTDFVTKDKHRDEVVWKKADNILSVHSIKVNNDKWEQTTIQRGDRQVEKEWRETKKLGSLIGDYQDMKQRIQLSMAAIE